MGVYMCVKWVTCNEAKEKERMSIYVCIITLLETKDTKAQKSQKNEKLFVNYFDFEIGHAFHFSFFHYYYYYSYTFIYIQRNERRQSFGVPRFGNVIFYHSLLCLVIPKNFGLYTEVINYLTQILILKMVINVD